jgi:hypothetical protein
MEDIIIDLDRSYSSSTGVVFSSVKLVVQYSGNGLAYALPRSIYSEVDADANASFLLSKKYEVREIASGDPLGYYSSLRDCVIALLSYLELYGGFDNSKHRSSGRNFITFFESDLGWVLSPANGQYWRMLNIVVYDIFIGDCCYPDFVPVVKTLGGIPVTDQSQNLKLICQLLGIQTDTTLTNCDAMKEYLKRIVQNFGGTSKAEPNDNLKSICYLLGVDSNENGLSDCALSKDYVKRIGIMLGAENA